MIRKCVQAIASISFAVSFILIILCLVIATEDAVSMIRTGEFKRLPVFNTVQWMSGIDELSKEERAEVIDRVGLYFLEELFKDKHLALWNFINFSTVFCFVNLIAYHVLYYFKIHIRKFFSVLVWAATFIALILIFSARIYASSGDRTLRIPDMFPVAYSIFHNFSRSIFFIAITHFLKHANHAKNALIHYFRTHSDDDNETREGSSNLD